MYYGNGEMAIKEKIIKYRHIFFTFLAMSVVYLNILHFAGTVCGGNVNWMIFSASIWGIPQEIEVGQNMVPLFQDGKTVGWDGQFYYYISNDILGVKDTPEHVDMPSYRWQRIGLPFCAYVISKVFGLAQVSVACFVLTNFFIVFLATAIFVKYLKDNQVSILYVLPWLFSFGVQITLHNCLVDAAADSFFICAFIFFLKKKIVWYSAFMTLACLTREGYANIAGMFFLIYLIKNAKNDIPLREKIEKCIILALPGIAIAGWILYVTLHFHVAPAQQAHGIVNYPFVDFFKCLHNQIHLFIADYNKKSLVEIIGLIIYFATLGMSVYFMYRLKKRSIFFAGMIPYVFMLACFGNTVMFDISGYWKGISVLFALLPIFMVLDKTIHARLKLACTIILSIELLMSVVMYSGRAEGFYPNAFVHLNNEVAKEAKIVDLNGTVRVKKIEKNNFMMLPMQKYFFSKDSATVSLTITNNTNDIWYNIDNEEKQYGVYIQGQWFKNERLIQNDPLYQMTRNVSPGGSIDMDMQVILPKNGEYTYKINLLQKRREVTKECYKDEVLIK